MCGGEVLKRQESGVEEEKRLEQGFLAGRQPLLGGIRHSGTGRATACVDAGGHRRRVNCQLR